TRDPASAAGRRARAWQPARRVPQARGARGPAASGRPLVPRHGPQLRREREQRERTGVARGRGGEITEWHADQTGEREQRDEEEVGEEAAPGEEQRDERERDAD